MKPGGVGWSWGRLPVISLKAKKFHCRVYRGTDASAGKDWGHLMFCGTKSIVVLGLTILLSPSVQFAQADGGQYEVGIVYYSSHGEFKAFDKETIAQGGRSTYSAKVKGEHAIVRLRADEPQVFRICGVDPSRFKLYRFKAEKNARAVTIAKNNVWVGGSKTVLTESEIPVAIQTAGNGCFTLTPRNSLGEGEYGFSPVESLDAFTFGVGDPKQSK